MHVKIESVKCSSSPFMCDLWCILMTAQCGFFSAFELFPQRVCRLSPKLIISVLYPIELIPVYL